MTRCGLTGLGSAFGRAIVTAVIVVNTCEPAAAQTAAASTDPVVLAAQRAQAQADALTAQYNAQAAAYNAQAAAVAAQLAPAKTAATAVTGSGLTGTVTPNTGAGAVEGQLLAEQLAENLTVKIAAGVGKVSCDKLAVYASTSLPAFNDLLAFETRKDLLLRIYRAADTSAQAAQAAFDALPTPSAKPGAKGRDFIAGAAAAGLALQTLGSIASYFQTDYQVGSITVTADDTMLESLLTKTLCPSGGSLLMDRTFIADGSAMFATDGAAPGGLDRLPAYAVAAADEKTRLTADAALLRDDQHKNLAGAAAVAARLDGAAAAQQTYLDAFTALLTDLSKADSNGVVWAAKIAQQKALRDVVTAPDARVLVVHMTASGGYLTKKNLWSFFGGEPFYVAASGSATYALLEPSGSAPSSTGGLYKVAKTGAVRAFTGYTQASKIPKDP